MRHNLLKYITKILKEHWAPLLFVSVVLVLHRDILMWAVPATGDHMIHLYKGWLMYEHMLPSGRVTGWSNMAFAGYPAGVYYPVLGDLLISLTRFITFGLLTWERTYTLLFLVLLVFIPLAVYIVGRRAVGKPAALTAAVLALGDVGQWPQGGHYSTVHWAVWPFMLGLSLSMICVRMSEGVLSRSIKESPKRFLAFSILVAMTVLAHPMTAFFLGIAAPVFVVVYVWAKYDIATGMIELVRSKKMISTAVALAVAAAVTVLAAIDHPMIAFFMGVFSVLILSVVYFIIKKQGDPHVVIFRIALAAFLGLLMVLFWVVPWMTSGSEWAFGWPTVGFGGAWLKPASTALKIQPVSLGEMIGGVFVNVLFKKFFWLSWILGLLGFAFAFRSRKLWPTYFALLFVVVLLFTGIANNLGDGLIYRKVQIERMAAFMKFIWFIMAGISIDRWLGAKRKLPDTISLLVVGLVFSVFLATSNFMAKAVSNLEVLEPVFMIFLVALGLRVLVCFVFERWINNDQITAKFKVIKRYLPSGLMSVAALFTGAVFWTICKIGSVSAVTELVEGLVDSSSIIIVWVMAMFLAYLFMAAQCVIRLVLKKNHSHWVSPATAYGMTFALVIAFIVLAGWSKGYSIVAKVNHLGGDVWADITTAEKWIKNQPAGDLDRVLYQPGILCLRGKINSEKCNEVYHRHIFASGPVRTGLPKLKLGYEATAIFKNLPLRQRWPADSYIIRRMIQEKEAFKNLHVRWVFSLVDWPERDDMTLVKNFGIVKIYSVEAGKTPPVWLDGSGKLEVKHFSDEKISVRVEGAAPNTMVRYPIASYYPWHAYQDQKEIPIETYGILSGTRRVLMTVKAVDGVIELRYERPWYERVAGWTSFIMWILVPLSILALAVIQRRRRQKPAKVS